MHFTCAALLLLLTPATLAVAIPNHYGGLDIDDNAIVRRDDTFGLSDAPVAIVNDVVEAGEVSSRAPEEAELPADFVAAVAAAIAKKDSIVPSVPTSSITSRQFDLRMEHLRPILSAYLAPYLAPRVGGDTKELIDVILKVIIAVSNLISKLE
ncbi:hypothetical protein V494_07202 [Pseudogymnoascus sp. VKM F-4513 (FW-928)]|nr:hypothetical protein V494_07202 [Pseudogymnoascus sp. VKM F-4513 (FW-928)]